MTKIHFDKVRINTCRITDMMCNENFKSILIEKVRGETKLIIMLIKEQRQTQIKLTKHCIAPITKKSTFNFFCFFRLTFHICVINFFDMPKFKSENYLMVLCLRTYFDNRFKDFLKEYLREFYTLCDIHKIYLIFNFSSTVLKISNCNICEKQFYKKSIWKRHEDSRKYIFKRNVYRYQLYSQGF